MVRRVRKAVLPVAGFGTRVLPATKAIPKEMLPVFDRPALQYVVDEAMAAGIEHVVFVTGATRARSRIISTPLTSLRIRSAANRSTRCSLNSLRCSRARAL